MAQKLRYALPSVAVATLYSIPLWKQVNSAYSDYSTYFRDCGPNAQMIAAAIIHTLVVAAALFAAATAFTRRKPASTRFVDGLFVCSGIALPLAYLWLILPSFLIRNSLRLTVIAVSGFCLAIPKYRRLFVSAGFTVLCSLALLPVIMTADIAWRYARSVSIVNGSFSRIRSRVAAPRRLVWVVLDEFDPGIAIAARPAHLKLPNLDRLLQTSMTGSNVFPAGAWTREVIPAYFIGRRVRRVVPAGDSGLRLQFMDGGEAALPKVKTVFDRMADQGVRAAATGWYMPICRWLATSPIEECVWIPSADALDSLREEFAGRRFGLPWALKHSFVSAATRGNACLQEEYRGMREQQLQAFQGLHASALRQLAEPALGFLFLHYNIPHPLGIFDARRGQLDASGQNTYLDNLVLTDRVLGELMEAASRKGGPGRTAFLITSDHSFRPQIWKDRETWSTEAPEVRAHPKDPRVLFLFHDSSDTERIQITEKLNAVSGHDLALAWTAGRLNSHREAADWLRQDKSAEK